MARATRTYVAVDVNYHEDDRVLAAGDAWQLHFTAMLAAKRGTADGYVSKARLRRAAPESIGDRFEEMYATLVDVGLFIEKDDGVLVRSWERWNDTQAEIERKSANAVYANHCKSHVGKGKKPSAKCRFCTLSDDDPTRTQGGPGSDSDMGP